MVAVIRSVRPLITVTFWGNVPWQATYTLPVTGLTATPCGTQPSGMVAVTVLDRPLITDRSRLSSALVTYTVPVNGLTATACGKAPTGMVAVTVLVRPLITDTVSLPLLVT